MVHRGIATLSGAMMVCFLSLTQFDSPFFLLHFYESLIYLVIILMLFYLEDRWAYMLGILAPGVWVILQIANGLLFGAFRQVGSYLSSGMRPTGVGIMTLVTFVLSILMVVFCARHWKRELSGLGKGWSTLLPCLGIVIVYYGILLYWFGRLFPWE
jgi:hypothetical protein